MNGSQRSAMGLALLVLAVTFGVGTFFGTRLRTSADLPTRTMSPILMEMGAVIEQLQLNEDQTQRVNSVLRQRSEQTTLTMEDVGNRLSIIADSLDAEIRSILTNVQLVRYDSLIADQRSRIRMRRPQPSNLR